MAVKERKTDEAERQVLLFGFEDLRSILDIKEALEPFGAALVPVGRGDYGKRLAVLAGVEDPSDRGDGDDWESGAVVGRMALLCGLRKDLDAILPALAEAGAGQGCLKAVLTEHNRAWTPVRLYQELSAEHKAIREAAKP